MRTTINIISVLALIALSLFMAALDLFLRFRHPEFTETQLFLNYWKLNVGVFVLALVLLVTHAATRD